MLGLPSPVTRIAVWSADSNRRSILGLRLTPGSFNAPWRKEYRYSEPIDGQTEEPFVAETPLFQRD